jgi:hypothetical protein
MANDDKKQDVLNSWDDAADDVAKTVGVSASVAKALLAMNPALRDQGLDTMKLVRQSQDAAVPQQGAKAPAKPSSKQGVYDLLRALDADVKRRDAELVAQIAQLEAERKKLAAGARENVSKWLVENDPDILSPVTQGALKDFAALITAIAFKTQDYVAQYRKKPR